MRAAFVAVLLGAVAACAGPRPIASPSGASPTGAPTPSLEAAAPTVLAPSESPRSSPAPPAAAVSPPPGVPTRDEVELAPEVAMTVSVAELHVRSAPSIESDSVWLAKRGDVFVLFDHPVVDGQSTWYFGWLAIQGKGALPDLPIGYWPRYDPPIGWVAFGRGDDHYLRRLPPRCPTVIDLAHVHAMLGSERVACLSGQSIELEGSKRCLDCGGASWVGQPEWLANGFRDPVLYDSGAWLSLYFPPGLDNGGTDVNIVRVRGHFDDPAAQTCRIQLVDETVLHEADAVAHCRTRFVVERMQVLGPDPSWEGI